MVTDSAAAATAILSGQKVNFYTTGVNENVRLYNCSNVNENKVTSILKHGMDAGKILFVLVFLRNSFFNVVCQDYPVPCSASVQISKPKTVSFVESVPNFTTFFGSEISTDTQHGNGRTV